MSIDYNFENLDIRHSRLFIKNLVIFLIPVILPVLILGSFSIVITHQYIQNNIDIHNENLLKQVSFNIEIIFEQIESIYSSIANNPEINQNLKRILKSNTITIDDYSMIRSVSNFINAQEKASSYVHSFYLYYENKEDRFLTTSQGLIVDNNYYDMKWLEEYLENKNKKEKWLSYRRLNPHGFNKSATDVITLYWVMKTDNDVDGVLVLNIYADYIEQLLKSMDTLPEQYILVQAEDGTIFFSNKELSYIDELDMLYTLRADKEGIIKTQLKSQVYDWSYFSVVPEKIIYRIPLKIRKILTTLLVLLIIIGVIVSYYLTRRNYKRISNIIEIINHAEQGKQLPEVKKEIRDEYSFITNKIVKTFIENSYLKLQVSEKVFRQKTLELLALQAQINPHFLYNTLETIYWKVFQFTGYPNQANLMLENLSDILKYSLHQPREKVKIAEEISYTKNYLEIQKIRYKDKFDVYWQYPKSLMERQIIKLVLQPLVENAIYYGIKEKEGKCGIKLKFRVAENMVKISIIDNGIGVNKKELEEIQNILKKDDTINSRKVGLCNTNKRLILMYGNKARIHIRSKLGMGTVVFFSIPIEEH